MHERGIPRLSRKFGAQQDLVAQGHLEPLDRRKLSDRDREEPFPLSRLNHACTLGASLLLDDLDSVPFSVLDGLAELPSDLAPPDLERLSDPPWKRRRTLLGLRVRYVEDEHHWPHGLQDHQRGGAYLDPSAMIAQPAVRWRDERRPRLLDVHQHGIERSIEPEAADKLKELQVCLARPVLAGEAEQFVQRMARDAPIPRNRRGQAIEQRCLLCVARKLLRAGQDGSPARASSSAKS
jgi:hypothetical protein